MAYFYPLSILATIVATALGAFIATLNKKMPRGIMVFLQNFSTGALVAFLFLELYLESINSFSSFYSDESIGALVALSIILGTGIFFYILHILIDKISHHHHHEDEVGCEDHAHVDMLIHREHKSLFVSTLVFFIAIFTHNIPEGFSLGLSFSDASNLMNGYLLSSILFLHNVIIAYAMASSLKNENVKNRNIFLITLSSAIPAFVFAIVGFYLGDVLTSNIIAQGVLVAISAGSLSFILVKELLPPLFTTYKSKLTPLYFLLGVAIFACLLFLHVH